MEKAPLFYPSLIAEKYFTKDNNSEKVRLFLWQVINPTNDEKKFNEFLNKFYVL